MNFQQAKDLIMRILSRNKAVSMNALYKNNKTVDHTTFFYAYLSLRNEGKVIKSIKNEDDFLYLIEQKPDFMQSVEAFEQPILEFGRPVEAFDGQRHKFYCKNEVNKKKSNFFLNLLYFGKFTALRRKNNLYEVREKINLRRRKGRKYRYSFVGYYTSDELKTFIEESKC